MSSLGRGHCKGLAVVALFASVLMVAEVRAALAQQPDQRSPQATDAVPAGTIGVDRCLPADASLATFLEDTFEEEAPTEVAQKPSRRKGRDSCEYARDGECDEPDLCARGTDTSDCEATEDEDYEEDEDSEGDEEDTKSARRSGVGRSCCMFNGGRCGPFTDQPAYPVGSPCSCQYGNPNADGSVCR